MDFEKIREILTTAAEGEGLDKYEIYFTRDTGMSAETLGDEISSFSGKSESGVSFRCIVGGHMGMASTELFAEEELAMLVRRAKANAEVIENDNPAVIFAGSGSYAELPQKELTKATAAEIKQLALDIQKNTYAESEYVTDGTQSAVIFESAEYELANSEGLRLSSKVGVRAAYAVAVVNKDGEASDAFDAALGFEDTEELSKNAVADALSSVGAESVPSGKYRVIISGKTMRSLLATYTSVFSGKMAALGLSLLAGKENEKIAADCVTLTDDPHGENNPVPTAFDGEGVATYKKNVIENGTLKTLLYDISYAAAAGKESTGNGQRPSYASQVGISPYCFYIAAGECTDKELLESLGDGLYITELKGLHAGADAVTGDFSIESAGYEVKDGEKIRAVKGFTVAGNFFELLMDIVAISDNVKFGLPSGFTTYGAPDVLVQKISVAGM